MSSAEKFCLKWNDFSENISISYRDLREDTDFSNVTLVGEGNQQIEAHKVILATSSPFFKDILKQNKHPHPMIYMRGITTDTLAAVIDFLYHGEANIFQRDLESFLTLAEELQLKGLTAGGGDYQELHSQKLTQKNGPTKSHTYYPQEKNIGNRDIVKIESSDNTYQCIENPTTDGVNNVTDNDKQPTYGVYNVTNKSVVDVNGMDYSRLDEQILTMMERVEGGWNCMICTRFVGGANSKQNMKHHIEGKHTEGGSLPCNKCGKTYRSREHLRKHTLRTKCESK